MKYSTGHHLLPVPNKYKDQTLCITPQPFLLEVGHVLWLMGSLYVCSGTLSLYCSVSLHTAADLL